MQTLVGTALAAKRFVPLSDTHLSGAINSKAKYPRYTNTISLDGVSPGAAWSTGRCSDRMEPTRGHWTHRKIAFESTNQSGTKQELAYS